MNVGRLLRSAMKATGAIDTQGSIEPEEYDDALEDCNMMLNSWAAQGHIVYHIVTESLSLVIGQASYTIGTGGNFNTQRPNEIIGGFVRDTDNNDYPIKVIDREEHNNIVTKTVRSRPEKVYYYPSFPLGTLYFYYVPNKAYTVSLDSLKPLTAISSIDNDLNMPSQYEEAIKWNLAVRLCPVYQRSVTPEIAKLAKDSFDVLSFHPVPKAKFNDVPGVTVRSNNVLVGD